MHQGWSRTISGLLTLATLVFTGFIVRDAQGAELGVSPSPRVSSSLAVVVTSTSLPTADNAVAVQTEKKVIPSGRVVTPLRKTQPVVTVTPSVVATQSVAASPVMAPSATSTPVPMPAVTSTPRPIGVTYAITGGGADVQGQIETQRESVGELTKRIAAARGVSFVYEASDMGWFVTEIAGVKQNPRTGYYWLFYVNGALANRSADQVLIKAGDTLTWRYEKTN